jgi:hypothetical protein
MTPNDIDRPLVQDEPHDADDEMSIPPHSAQAEEAVLGAVLKRGLAIADMVPVLKPQHFYEARHRYIYPALARPPAVEFDSRAMPAGQPPVHRSTGQRPRPGRARRMPSVCFRTLGQSLRCQ